MTYEIRHNTAVLTETEYENFNEGETIFGKRDENNEVVSAFDTISEARTALQSYRCSYEKDADGFWHIEEYGFVYDDDCGYCDLWFAPKQEKSCSIRQSGRKR